LKDNHKFVSTKHNNILLFNIINLFVLVKRSNISLFIYNIYFIIVFQFYKFVLLAQYCAGDKIEKNEMGWACGAYG